MTSETSGLPEAIRIHGGQVLTCDADGTVLDKGEVWIEAGDISAVGPQGAVQPPDGAAVRDIDASGRLVLPGLINGHCHSYAGLLKGTVDAQPLDIYMLHVIAAGMGRTDRAVKVSALVDCITMIRTGSTSVIDHFAHRPATTDEALDAVMDAYEEAGMRAAVAPMYADLPYPETVPLDISALPEDVRKAYADRGRLDPVAYFEVMERAVKKGPRVGGRVGLLLGVDGPQRCSDELLEMTADFQKRHGLGLHTHMLETKTQAVMAKNGSFVRKMADAGILNKRSSLVHFIWCSDEDIAAAKDAGVTIVHVPGSNMMVGSGVCPMLKLRDSGLPIAVGTDGFNVGVPSMFEKLRLACLLARVTEPEFENWPTAEGVIKMALEGGARALGLPGALGVLEAGAKADVVVLDPSASVSRPMGDAWNHLVYYETGANVESVVIDGQIVLDEGRFTTMDEEAILAEAEDIVARHRSEADGAADEIARQYPAFHDMVVSTLSNRGELERLIRFD